MSTKHIEALMLALAGAANYIDALGGDSRKYRQALAEQPAQQEPLFWYRPCSNGMYEGPIHNAQIERVRKESGAWHPLYTSPPASKPLTGQRISIEDLEQENRLIRARSDRLQKTLDGIVPRLEQACGATAMPPLIIKKFIEEHAA